MPDDPKSRTQKELIEQQKVLREMGPYMTMGIQLALTILAFFGLGYWLDKHYLTGSLWTAICTSFGAVSALVYFVVTVLSLSKKEDAAARESASNKTETKGV